MLFSNWSFHKKIFIGMIIAALVPMLIGYIAMLQVFNVTYEKNLEQEADTAMSAVCTSLDVGLDNI